MRVTSTMKEYIRRKVSEVYDKKIDGVEKDYLAEKKRICEEIKALGKEFDNKVIDLLSQTDFAPYDENTHFYDARFNIYCNEWKDRITKEQMRLRDERRDTIEEIIVTLELGGNKADLDRMLKELEWEKFED